jgi:hypothetical protein
MHRAWLCALIVACRQPSATTSDAAPSGVSCSAVVASYESLVAAGGACKTDTDCACFNGGVSQKTPCGGVTDKATAAKLEASIKDYESGHCNALMCAAMMCTPSCSAGHCVNASH